MSLSTIAVNLVLPAPVLIVEDDMQVRLRLEDMLLQFGYGQDALIFAASLS